MDFDNQSWDDECHWKLKGKKRYTVNPSIRLRNPNIIEPMECIIEFCC